VLFLAELFGGAVGVNPIDLEAGSETPLSVFIPMEIGIGDL
jgi:hypothetical protein